MNKRTLDAIARHWDFKPPATWTQKQAERLCAHACDEYEISDGVWEPLLAADRAQLKEIKRTTKELERVVDARRSLQRVRKPTSATQRLLDAARTTEKGLADEVQMLTNGLVFDGLPENKSKKKKRGAPAGASGGPARARLLGDMAMVFQQLGAANLTKQARQVRELFLRHQIPCAGELSVRDSLRRLSK
jgi:hypothetical protein